MNDRSVLVGRLEFEPIRNVFPKEAHHFTKWLEEHIDVLAERIGTSLTVVQRERAVGDFNVDLLCEGPDGRKVIVENQLETSNHDHLGKVLTYLVNLEAGAAIWVTTDARIEHQRVIDWLNESTPADISFYLIRVEAARIGDSAAAPLFTVIAAPSQQAKTTGVEKKDWAERQHKQVDFWTALLQRSRDKTALFSNISPGRGNWISTGAGKAGIVFSYVILKDSAAVELYIDQGDATKNKGIFDVLFRQKAEIEGDFGGQLKWQRLDDKRACRISKPIPGKGLASPLENWPEIQDKMIDAMIRFDRAVRPRLGKGGA